MAIRNGAPLTGNAEGEEMTLTLHESARTVNYIKTVK